MRQRRVIAGVLGATVLTAAALRGVMRRFAIVEQSMAPALEPGDWVVAVRQSGAIDRGDVVITGDPTGSGMQLVKRVIGLPGEHLSIESGRVVIDGALLADRWASGATRPEGSWAIPDGHVFLLGDNRGASTSDSRIVGPIPIEALTWVVKAVYYPTARARRL